ncbi:MAG: Ig-like domain-containing protein [Balneolaceae bacterium]|nr:Ig-like domain-containing protein [Balneolaceae bacterium]
MRHLALLLLVLLLASCATPTAPTGGERDQEGPRVVATEPETGTTGFEGRSITFRFSEFVNRGSLEGALTLEPELGMAHSLDWGRKSVTVELEHDLPDSTTLIVSIGTGLADMNGNSMAQPVKVAVSSGAQIDEGTLTGIIRDARTGARDAGFRVLLYREPVDFSEPAVYSSETDTSGRFSFAYLGTDSYVPVWVDDRNRNKTWDRGTERAQPFSSPSLQLARGASDTLATLYVAGADTSAPILRGVGLFSRQRLRLRFSENVALREQTRITVTDSTGAALDEGYALYVSSTDPYVLFAHSVRPLHPDSSYGIRVRGISDEAGNVRDSTFIRTGGSAQADTTRQRVVGALNLGGLYPDEPLTVVYAAPISGAAVVDSVKIVRGTEMVPGQPRSSAERNRLTVRPDGSWQGGVDYEFRVWDPASDSYRRYSPEIWQPRDMGGLYVETADTSLARRHRLRLYSPERGVVADTTFGQSIELEDLPPLEYRVVVYHDRNGDGEWDPGTVEPYAAPEPYFIQQGVPLRSGFVGEVTVSFGLR